jgi:hypothetical protein
VLWIPALHLPFFFPFTEQSSCFSPAGSLQSKLPARQSNNDGTHVERQQSPPSYANSSEFTMSSQAPSAIQIAGFAMLPATLSTTCTAGGTVTVVGADVGAFVGDGVVAIHTLPWQWAFAEQSPLSSHF